MGEEKKITRKQLAEQTKIKIFNAALDLLNEKDLDSITVRDIVKKANVSIGSFYNYYSTKLEVFYETYVLADDYFENTVKPQLTEPLFIDRIIHFFKEYGYYQTNIGSYSLTKVLYNSDNTCFHRHSEQGMTPILTELCSGAKASGEFSSSKTAEKIAEFLMICARGVCYDWCISEASYSLSDRLTEASSLLVKAFQ